MKIPKLKMYDIIEIDWLDSVHASGWQRLNEQKDSFGSLEFLNHYTVGYFIQKTKYSIVVIQSRTEWKLADGNNSIDAIMEIPLCSITKIKVLSTKR